MVELSEARGLAYRPLIADRHGLSIMATTLAALPFFTSSTRAHESNMPPHEDDEDYFLPLEDQRVFGAGIRRKRVPFVRSSEHELNSTSSTRPGSTTPSGASIADKYLSIVLKQPSGPSTSPNTPEHQDPSPSSRTTPSASPTPKPIASPSSQYKSPTSPEPDNYCEICNLPLPSESSNTDADTDTEKPPTRPHEASLAHQACLTHSHPPSHLDRNRAGLRYLSTYGWDPDSRLGLGAQGREGIREPLKGRVKHDTAGLGVGLDADGDRIRAPPPQQQKKKKEKVQKLNAKQVRRQAVDARNRGEKLRRVFFQSDEVLKYLGEDG